MNRTHSLLKWDGNVPLHEWKYPLKKRPEWVVDEWGILSKDKDEPVESLVTWVFDEGTFKPSAKIIDGEQFSIIADYLGTPVEMYDAQGSRTWAVEYDIYDGGTLRKCPVDIFSERASWRAGEGTGYR